MISVLKPNYCKTKQKYHQSPTHHSPKHNAFLFPTTFCHMTFRTSHVKNCGASPTMLSGQSCLLQHVLKPTTPPATCFMTNHASFGVFKTHHACSNMFWTLLNSFQYVLNPYGIGEFVANGTETHAGAVSKSNYP